MTIIKSILFPSLGGARGGYMCLNRMGLIFFILSSFFVSSCSSDLDGPDNEKQGTPIHLAGYMAPYDEVSSMEAREYGITRTEPAWMPTGYTALADVKSITFGTFFATAPNTCDARRIYYHTTANEWFISGMEPPVGDFLLYGYMPYNTAEVEIAPKNSNYAEGATLTFNNMSCISTKDICVIVGASHGTNASTPVSLQTGKFNCTIKAGGEGNENYLFLLCDHLYAKLEFTFRVDNSEPYKYASLRTIKLRRLELMSYTYTHENLSDLTVMKKKGEIAVNLNTNTTSTSPIDGTIFFTPDVTSEDMDPVLLFDGEKELKSNEYTTETGYVPYFNLGGSGKVLYVLRSTYDVYDNKNNLIRKGCVAENTIVPLERFNIKQLARGSKYTLQLTVMPTYLYVLSEPDLDNPTISVE